MDHDKTMVSIRQGTVSDQENVHDKAYADSELAEHEVGLDLYRKADGIEYTQEESTRVSVFCMLQSG